MLKALTFQILSKPFEKRSPIELTLLGKNLKELPFFSKILEEKGMVCLLQLLKYISLEKFPLNSFVFQQNTFGSKFYIILKGKVLIFLTSSSLLITSPQENEENSLLLTEGQTFGELSLLTGQPRSANALCKEDCVLGVLEKRHFQMVMDSAYLQRINEKIEFLQEIPLFRNLSSKAINSMVYSLNLRNFVKGNPVYKENDGAEGLFIVKCGEFLVKKLKGNINIGVISVKEVFGFEEIMLKTQRKFTVECFSAKAEALFIKKRDFLKQIENCSMFFKEIMEFSLNREKFREEIVKKAETFREMKKKELIEKLSARNNCSSRNENKQVSCDFSIRSPFATPTKKRKKSNGCENWDLERLSFRKRFLKRKEDVSQQVDIIVKAKEQIFNKIAITKSPIGKLNEEISGNLFKNVKGKTINAQIRKLRKKIFLNNSFFL